MKPGTRLLFSLLVAGSFHLQPQAGVEGQIYVGAHGSLNEINRTAWGIGGRLGSLIHQDSNLTLALEGVGEYLWPSCNMVDCRATSFQANLLARRGVTGYTEVYAGLGVVYTNYTLEDKLNKMKGDDFGFSILAGTQTGISGGVRPFLEARFSMMGELDNQFGAALGIRVPVG